MERTPKTTGHVAGGAGRGDFDGCFRHGVEHPGFFHDSCKCAGGEKDGGHHERSFGVRIETFALSGGVREIDGDGDGKADHEDDDRREFAGDHDGH